MSDIEFIPQEYNAAVPLSELTPHPANPNQGDIGLLTQLFEANGFAGAVLAQKSTGILIDGETRWRTAKQNNLRTLPVIFVDVDNDTRDRLLAEWNESTRRGINDEEKLLSLLQGLAETPRGLEGAAFDGDDVDGLMARLGEPLNITGAPTGAGYSESDDEAAERQARTEGYRDRKEGGNLVEMILVFSTDQRAEVGRLLDSVRGLVGDKEARAADLMLLALRVTIPLMEGRPHDAAAISSSYTPTDPAAEEETAEGEDTAMGAETDDPEQD